MVIYGIFIMAVGKAAMHRSYLYPHNPTFGALSQGRARFFLRKSRSCASFSAQSMLGTRVAQQYALSGQHLFLHRLSDAHEPRRRFAPNGRWGFSLNLSWSAPPTAAGTCRAPRRGQEGRHQVFYPLNSHFLLGESGAACRYVTASKKEYGRGVFLP